MSLVAPHSLLHRFLLTPKLVAEVTMWKSAPLHSPATAIAAFCLFVCVPGRLDAQITITHFAGSVGGAGRFDGKGEEAWFSSPSGITVDLQGNVFVLDDGFIRKITPDSRVSTLSGLRGPGMSYADPSASRLESRGGIAIDSKGNLFFFSGCQINRLSPSGDIVPFAGSGQCAFLDGLGGAAAFRWGGALAIDASDTLYVADGTAIRTVRPDGSVRTLAGSGTAGSQDGTGSAAGFKWISAIGVDPAGNVVVCDGRVRRIRPDGVVSSLPALPDTGDNVASWLLGVAVDAGGSVYVADTGTNRLLHIAPDGAVRIHAGSEYGSEDGSGTTASFWGPAALALASNGTLFVVDSGNHTIRKVSSEGIVSTFAGSGRSGTTDGSGAGATFLEPRAVSTGNGYLYIADPRAVNIRRVEPAGDVTTFAGFGAKGPGASVEFGTPWAVAADRDGAVFVVARDRCQVWKILPDGAGSVLAGGLSCGNVDGPGEQARFWLPRALAMDPGGSLIVADFGNNKIRRISPTGVVSTLAGSGRLGSADGLGPAATFSYPESLAVDPAGNIYVVDYGGELGKNIRKVTPTGEVSTLHFIDPNGSPEWTVRPSGIAYEPSTESLLLIEGRQLWRVGADRIPRQQAGGSYWAYSEANRGYIEVVRSSYADGTGDQTSLGLGSGLTVAPDGRIFIADPENHAVRLGTTGLPDQAIVDRSPAAIGFERLFNTTPRTASSWRWAVAWRPAESKAELSATNVPNPTFVPDSPGSYGFRLEAGRGSSVGISYVTLDATEERMCDLFAGVAYSPLNPSAGDAVSFQDETLGVRTGRRFWNGLNRIPTEGLDRLPTTVFPMAGEYRAVLRAWNDTCASTATRIVRVSATRTDGPIANLFLPIVLSSAGRNGSFFSTELTITNKSANEASAQFEYRPAIGLGGGVTSTMLGAGRQLVISDTVSYLKSLGMTIPDGGDRGGTVRVTFRGLISERDGAVQARTLTPAPSAIPVGKAGLAYAAVAERDLLSGPAYLCGLRQGSSDRSNVAVQNPTYLSGSVSLRLSFVPGDGTTSSDSRIVTLDSGGFAQFGLTDISPKGTQGCVKIERVGGFASVFYAYAVINDNANSDGSFISPLRQSAMGAVGGIVVPAVVETSTYSTEMMLANLGLARRDVDLELVSSTISGGSASIRISLGPGEQQLMPGFVQLMRDRGAPGMPAAGQGVTGVLFVTGSGGPLADVFVGARTSNPGGGGRYGVYYSGVRFGDAFTSSAWLHGLQQTAVSRSNLAFVNTGEFDGSPSMFQIDVFDGSTGEKVSSFSHGPVSARGFSQLNAFLATAAPGVTNAYVHVRRTSGANPFIVYGVVNDGGRPGERTGDGAFLEGSAD